MFSSKENSSSTTATTITIEKVNDWLNIYSSPGIESKDEGAKHFFSMDLKINMLQFMLH